MKRQKPRLLRYLLTLIREVVSRYDMVLN